MDKTASFNFSLGWVDGLIAILLVVGVMRGRKRGMSEELIDILKWIVIVIAAAALYQPLGKYLSQLSLFSLLSCYTVVYGLIMLMVILIFAFVKRSVGDRLLGSDAFGNGEYYLGMVAGFFRYLCVIIVAMAFLNARYYSPTEIQAKAKFQNDNFGSSFFLTLPDLQRQVFAESLSGHVTSQYLKVALIQPTAGNTTMGEEKENIGRRRENNLDEITAKPKKRLDQRR